MIQVRPMKIKIHILSLLFVSISQIGISQKETHFENWTYFSVEKKTEKFSFDIEQAWRVREFYLSRQTYTDFTGSYKALPFLDISSGYRLTFKNSMFNATEVNHRLYLDVAVSKKFGNFDFSFRTRLQHTRLQWEDDYGLPYQTFSRNKFKVKYKLNEFVAISGGYEFFLFIIPSGSFINENRFSLDSQFKIGDKWSINAGYIFRNWIQQDPLQNINIMNLGVNYKL